MMTKNDVIRVVEKHCGKEWTKKGAAIDSIWWSLQNGRPREESIRGLANATGHGPFAPTEREIAQAEELYRKVEEMA